MNCITSSPSSSGMLKSKIITSKKRCWAAFLASLPVFASLTKYPVSSNSRRNIWRVSSSSSTTRIDGIYGTGTFRSGIIVARLKQYHGAGQIAETIAMMSDESEAWLPFDCPECERLWREYTPATQAFVRAESRFIVAKQRGEVECLPAL